MQYAEFAQVYDVLMSQVPYAAWVDFILKKTSPPKGAEVFDAACGTGSAALEFSKRGFKVTAMDISEDMLQVAAERFRLAGRRVSLIEGDIAHFSLHRPVNLITCVCDGVNYLTDSRDAQRFLDRAFGFLKTDGALAFDISGVCKLEERLPGNLFYEDRDEITYFGQSEFKDGICGMELTFFVKQPGGLYERFDERHFQRAYGLNEIKGMLLKSGFEKIECLDGYSDRPAVPESERMLFIAYK